MKPVLIASLLVASLFSFGQNRQIEFTHDMEEAKILAKKHNKLIFVDAYTSWCGPCKWMAKNKFTNDTIADFYNTNFIAVKLDMEKGVGVDFAKTYAVKVYPTLLFINAEGKLLHKSVGAMGKTASYIDLGLTALNPITRMEAMQKAWNNGERSHEFTVSYLAFLSDNYMQVEPVLTAYYNELSDQEMESDNTWKVISTYDNTTNSKGINHLMSNKEAFAQRHGQDKVDEILYSNYKSYLMKKVYAKEFSMKELQLAMIEVKNKEIPYWQKIVLEADLAHLEKEKKYKEYCEVATDDVSDYFMDDANALNSFAWNVFEWSNKKKELEIALTWAKQALTMEKSPAVQDTYANLLFKLKRKQEAIEAQKLAIEWAKQNGDDPTDYEKVLQDFMK